MKPYEERLPLIDEAIDYLDSTWPDSDLDYLLEFNGRYNWHCSNKKVAQNNYICTRDEFEQRVKEREEMKNKNDWYIKGDLPPEGSIVIINIDYKLTNGFKTLDVKAGEKVRVVQHVDYGYGKVCLISVRNNSFGATIIFSNLRPLRTEEDELMERALDDAITNRNEELQVNPVIVNSLRKLIKAGWRPTEKKDD